MQSNIQNYTCVFFSSLVAFVLSSIIALQNREQRDGKSPHTPTFILKVMVYLLDLQLVLWFVFKPLIDYVEEMANVINTTQLGFYLEIQIYPFCAPMLCLDLQLMKHVKQLDPQSMVLAQPPALGWNLCNWSLHLLLRLSWSGMV